MAALAPIVGQGTFEAQGVGTLWLAWSERGLVRLALPGSKEVRAIDGVPEAALPEMYAKVLSAYFAGENVDPVKLPVDLRGTDFQVRVWEALRRIPYGDVRSYQSVAVDVHAPRAMRAVGMANGKNPVAVVVPCHRVVEAGQRLGGFSSGLETKRKLLALEGVRVEGDLVFRGQLSLLDPM